MKTKIVPTSPKNQDAHRDQDVEDFMRTPSSIQQPHVIRFSLYFLILAVVVGFLAGAVGATVLTYGREQWYWVQRFLGAPAASTPAVVNPVTKREAPVEQYADTVSKVQGNVVAIFSRRTPLKKNPSTLDQLYLPADYRGAGTLLTEDGIGVTSRQAIPDLTKEVAIVARGVTYTTKDFYPDPASDAVFFRIAGKGFPVLNFADPAGLVITQRVLDVGRDPTTLTVQAIETVFSTLASFPVSGQADFVRSSERLLASYRVQHGAGAPGEPVFTLGGNLAGMHVGTGTDIIPVSILSSGLTRLQQTGRVTRNVFGVRYLDLAIASGLTLTTPTAGTAGALLMDAGSAKAVTAKSPADRAGLKAGDVITQVDDHVVTAAASLTELIQAVASRGTVTVTFTRGSSEQHVPVTLDITP